MMTQIMGKTIFLNIKFWYKINSKNILGSDKQGLTFEIISAKIANDSDEKKYVIYTLQVRFISGNDDLSPSIIERRYTHFLNLYNALKKEHAQLMTNVAFPKKVLMGNFDNELISARSSEFETFLKHVAQNSKLRTSNSILAFLQDVELNKAKSLIEKNDHIYAYPILENIFKLLNKVSNFAFFIFPFLIAFIFVNR